MTILVTGVAGFIGFHLASQLLKKGNDVLGIDNLSKYYDVNLKKNRLTIILVCVIIMNIVIIIIMK